MEWGWGWGWGAYGNGLDDAYDAYDAYGGA